MSEYTKIVPKHPTNADETLKAVLEVIIFQTADADEFIQYKIKPDKVELIFEAID
jgi:hypothetical protein